MRLGTRERKRGPFLAGRARIEMGGKDAEILSNYARSNLQPRDWPVQYFEVATFKPGVRGSRGFRDPGKRRHLSPGEFARTHTPRQQFRLRCWTCLKARAGFYKSGKFSQFSGVFAQVSKARETWASHHPCALRRNLPDDAEPVSSAQRSSAVDVALGVDHGRGLGKTSIIRRAGEVMQIGVVPATGQLE